MIAHHTFSPWRIRNGDERIVVPESAWRRVASWDRAAAKAGERRRVLCPFDVFEGWPGPMQASNGAQVWKRTEHDGEWTASDHYRDTVALTMQDVRRRLFDLISVTPNLDWLLLTKRIENVPSMMASVADPRGLDHHKISKILGSEVQCPALPPNLWIGVSVEDQATADERSTHLKKIPAAVRLLSCEPLLGPINLFSPSLRSRDNQEFAMNYIHWVIVGGESGPRARPMHPDWVRSIRDQCAAANVPFFFTQWGEWEPTKSHPTHWLGTNGESRPVGSGVWASDVGIVRVGRRAAGRLLDGRTHDEVPV